MKTRRVAALVTAFWLVPEVRLAACPICFRVEESNVIDGVRLAVVVLVAVTIVVLAGFIRFALRVARAQRGDR